MRAISLVVALLVTSACGDNKVGSTPKEDAGITEDAAVDAPPGALKHCLERHENAPIAPSGQLPCDLLPPGFGE